MPTKLTFSPNHLSEISLMISNTEKEKKIFRFVGIYYISKYELKQLFSLIYVSITEWMHSKGYVLWPIIIKKCKYKSIEGHYFMWINLGHYLNNKMFIKCECSKKHQSVTK